jgi:hypothetical protein
MTQIERTFNVATGETTERELTQAEIDTVTIPEHAKLADEATAK